MSSNEITKKQEFRSPGKYLFIFFIYLGSVFLIYTALYTYNKRRVVSGNFVVVVVVL